MAETVDKMVIDMGLAKACGADLVEIRLDSLKDFNPHGDLKTLIKECPLPTLFTYRFFTRDFYNFRTLLLLYEILQLVMLLLLAFYSLEL